MCLLKFIYTDNAHKFEKVVFLPFSITTATFVAFPQERKVSHMVVVWRLGQEKIKTELLSQWRLFSLLVGSILANIF